MNTIGSGASRKIYDVPSEWTHHAYVLCASGTKDAVQVSPLHSSDPIVEEPSRCLRREALARGAVMLWSQADRISITTPASRH
jgi:hypothetical protein